MDEENKKNKIVTPTDEDVREELQKICNEIDRAITSAGGRSKLKAACPDCIVAQYPPCEKNIPCCQCHEETCNSRQPCPRKEASADGLLYPHRHA